MDILQETNNINKKTFFTHVFSTTEEGKAELLNVVQYATLALIPVIALNKLVARFIPDADSEKSSLEITIEVLLQIIIMFCGIVIIHRVITYLPTYSGFKYENLVLTNVILAFLVIVLSIQTKLGIKVNILVDRLGELWNGPTYSKDRKNGVKSSVRVSAPMSQHMPSQADYLDNSATQQGMFPPAPVATSKPQSGSGYDHMMGGGSGMMETQLMPANSLLGSAFGAF
jgi:hypothetical protein